MWQINLITGAFLFFLGFIIKKYQLTYLIAGYNTASKEEKEKYDEEKLVKGVGNFLMYSATILILGSLLSIIFNVIGREIIIVSWILFTTYTLSWVIYVNVKGTMKKVN